MDTGFRHLIGHISWLLIGWTRSIQKATLHLSRLVTGSIDRG